MINDLCFSKEYEYVVEMYDNQDELLGSGRLKFGAGQFVRVEIDGFFSLHALDEDSNLNAKAENGDVFTLITCTLEDFTIYADLIVCGRVDSSIESITVRFSNISEWFLYDQRVHSKPGESIIWGDPPPPIEATVITALDSFNINSRVDSFILNKSDKRVIREHVHIIFTKNDKPFEFLDIKEKPSQLACLLSILIAYPISITHIWIAEKEGQHFPSYFPAFEKPKRAFQKNQFWRNSLIRRKTLDAHWPDVFARYYNSPHRATIWARLAGMQRYKGFWEYRVLGYVTLLDSYTDVISRVDAPPLKKDRKSERAAVLQQLTKVTPPLTDLQLTKIENILNNSMPDKRVARTFKEKYDYVMSKTNPEVAKIINITESDFKIIKGARDAIAHNNALKLERYPYEKIHPIIGKVGLLLTFMALNEFGISSSDFVRSLGNTGNELRNSEALDMTQLEKILHPESFFSVSEALFEQISNFKQERLHPVFTLNSNGEIKYSEEQTLLYRQWINSRPQQSRPAWEVLGVDKDSVTIVDQMHVEFEDRVSKLIFAHIIKI
ncbi:hypothetical protein [Pseudomonas coronafaciens]|uniref:ApeA N-terminal domain 1-containing protein n=1 Tax=Pseudomonas coronafaciens TaxID=53409 RepID=UPI000EFF4632|nr:hypothetical protein [Pseudomonas coronafaciens]